MSPASDSGEQQGDRVPSQIAKHPARSERTRPTGTPEATLLQAIQRLDKRIAGLELAMKRSQQEAVREVDSANFLDRVLQPQRRVPAAGGWAASYQTLAYVVSKVLEGREVLEVGSGSSTIWFGLACRQSGRGHVVSLEHEEKYRLRTDAQVRHHGLQDWVTVVQAPLVSHHAMSCDWYDVPTPLVADKSIDLLFVDGPPGGTGPLARWPALGMLSRYLRDGAAIILDDTDRPDEGEVAARWLNEPPAGIHLCEVDDIGRSKVFELRRPIDTGN